MDTSKTQKETANTNENSTVAFSEHDVKLDTQIQFEKSENGEYSVTSGHGRIRAMQRLGLPLPKPEEHV